MDRKRRIRLHRNALPKNESRNVSREGILYHVTVANEEGRGTYSWSSQRKIGAAEYGSKAIAKHVEWLNPKIQGWRNYYYTNYSQKRLAKLDWYILQRLTRWYAKKRQRGRWMSSSSAVNYMVNRYGLKTLL
jgi:hypothetical protein